MRLIRLLIFAFTLLSPAAAAAADAYPTRPIRLVVPFPAGGTADVVARVIQSGVGAQLGQSIVVDNRGGANGIIGTDIVAKAPPDGHTLLHTTGSFAINPSIYRKLPYDIFRDFEPVSSVVVGTGYLLLAHPAVPVSSAAELVALAKKPQKVTYSSPGAGNPLHLAAELFNTRAGVKLMHVPYKGVAQAMNAAMSGEVQVMFIPATIALAHVKSGKLKGLAFTGSSRFPGLPDVPTMKEAGVANFELTGGWHAWFAPAKTPQSVLARLHEEIHKALQLQRVREAIIAGGYEPDGKSPAQSRKTLREEYERYAEMVRAANIPKE